MAKMIVKFSYAKLKNVETDRVDGSEDWKWRKNFVGEFGTLSIYESEHKRPGKLFAYLKCADGSWLRKGYGKYNINENELTVNTDNSVYVFEIYREEEKSWVDEKMEQGQ